MKLKKITLTVFVLCLLSSAILADSPLTSTDFARAYAEEPIVIAASKTDGFLTSELMDYLTDDRNPIDLKMAVINKLSWNIKGKSNAQVFLKYLMQNYGYANENELLENGKGDILLSMAYLKALDDYFKVDNALIFADKALKTNEKSRTYNLIAGLIRAQKVFSGNWCEVYQTTDRIRRNHDLNDDMKMEAIEIIYKYMDIYGDYCK